MRLIRAIYALRASRKTILLICAIYALRASQKIILYSCLCTRNILGGSPRLDIILTHEYTWGLHPHMKYQYTKKKVLSATLEGTPSFGYLGACIGYYKFGDA